MNPAEGFSILLKAETDADKGSENEKIPPEYETCANGMKSDSVPTPVRTASTTGTQDFVAPSSCPGACC